MTITICANGLIMIPVKIRCELDINAGDSLTFFIGNYNVQDYVGTKYLEFGGA